MKRRLKIKSVKEYGKGGQVKASDAINATGDIASMFPGIGTAIGGIMKIGAGFVGQGEDSNQAVWDASAKAKEEQWDNHPQPSSPVIMALGGEMLKSHNAPDHTEGGQMLDQNSNPTEDPNQAVAEIEKDEATLDGYAYSPNLVDDLSGKTFADAARGIERKYKKGIESNDDIARRTRDKEMTRLKDNNDRTREGLESNASFTKALGGYLTKRLANGGPIGDPTKLTSDELITPNNSYDFGSGDFTGVYDAMGNNPKNIQSAMQRFQTKTGDQYDFGGVDGIVGNKTKGFFNDPIRSRGLRTMLQEERSQQGSLTFNPSTFRSAHPNQVQTYTQADQTGATPDPINFEANKYLHDNNLDPDRLAKMFSNSMSKNNLVNKSGKNVPLSEQGETSYIESEDGSTNTDAEQDSKKKKGKFFKDLAKGKHDSKIGAGLKAAEMVAAGIAAFRPTDKIKTEHNMEAAKAEDEMRKRGQQLTSARNRNEQGVAQSLRGNQNAMSQSVKFALDQAAQDKGVMREIDIAGKEKALNDNVAMQLSNMISRHGTERKNARNLQEVKQSQTNAVAADAKKTFAESVGNMGEFFAKKGATRKKAKEQFMLLGQKYPNFTVADIDSYNDAIQSGNIDKMVTFIKANGSISLDQALEDADKTLTAKQKAKLKKKLGNGNK